MLHGKRSANTKRYGHYARAGEPDRETTTKAHKYQAKPYRWGNRYFQKLTQRCEFEHNRKGCPGETLTKVLPTINRENVPLLMHIQRISKMHHM